MTPEFKITTPEFTFSILMGLSLIWQLLIILVPIAVLVILIKINKKLDTMIKLLQTGVWHEGD